jgi:hypothetical protein
LPSVTKSYVAKRLARKSRDLGLRVRTPQSARSLILFIFIQNTHALGGNRTPEPPRTDPTPSRLHYASEWIHFEIKWYCFIFIKGWRPSPVKIMIFNFLCKIMFKGTIEVQLQLSYSVLRGLSYAWYMHSSHCSLRDVLIYIILPKKTYELRCLKKGLWTQCTTGILKD